MKTLTFNEIKNTSIAKEYQNKILKLLEILGKQSKTIANFFEKNEILGIKKDGAFCPIATYLKNSWSDILCIVVEEDNTYCLIQNKKHQIQFEIENPIYIKKFIKDFDNNKYPNLYK